MPPPRHADRLHQNRSAPIHMPADGFSLVKQYKPVCPAKACRLFATKKTNGSTEDVTSTDVLPCQLARQSFPGTTPSLYASIRLPRRRAPIGDAAFLLVLGVAFIAYPLVSDFFSETERLKTISPQQETVQNLEETNQDALHDSLD